MITPRASNWVDHGEPPHPKIAKTLRHFLQFDRDVSDAALLEYAETVVAMVEADASEVQVSSYLGHIEEEHGRTRSPAKHRRLEAIALWHIAKAALTRDRKTL